jgi:hypothetical protein
MFSTSFRSGADRRSSRSSRSGLLGSSRRRSTSSSHAAPRHRNRRHLAQNILGDVPRPLPRRTHPGSTVRMARVQLLRGRHHRGAGSHWPPPLYSEPTLVLHPRGGRFRADDGALRELGALARAQGARAPLEVDARALAIPADFYSLRRRMGWVRGRSASAARRANDTDIASAWRRARWCLGIALIGAGDALGVHRSWR